MKAPSSVPGPGQGTVPLGRHPLQAPSPVVCILYVNTEPELVFIMHAWAEPGTALAPGDMECHSNDKRGSRDSEGRWSRQASLGGDLGRQK